MPQRIEANTVSEHRLYLVLFASCCGGLARRRRS
jgi:hypothetical protein